MCRNPTCSEAISIVRAHKGFRSPDGEFSFVSMATFSIVSKDGPLWEGSVNGKQGFFPSNMVEELSVFERNPAFEVPVDAGARARDEEAKRAREQQDARDAEARRAAVEAEAQAKLAREEAARRLLAEEQERQAEAARQRAEADRLAELQRQEEIAAKAAADAETQRLAAEAAARVAADAEALATTEGQAQNDRDEEIGEAAEVCLSALLVVVVRERFWVCRCAGSDC